jgi:hypothetical protein
MPTAQPRRHAGHHQRGRQPASGTTSPRQAPATRTHRTSQAPQTPGQANRTVRHHGSRRWGASRASRRSARSAICCHRYPGKQLCWGDMLRTNRRSVRPVMPGWPPAEARRCGRSAHSCCTLGLGWNHSRPPRRAQRRIGTCLAARQLVLVSPAEAPRGELPSGLPTGAGYQGQDAKRRQAVADDARPGLSVICRRYRRGGR